MLYTTSLSATALHYKYLQSLIVPSSIITGMYDFKS